MMLLRSKRKVDKEPWWLDYLDIGVISKVDLVGKGLFKCEYCGNSGYVSIEMVKDIDGKGSFDKKLYSFCSRCEKELISR